MGTSATHRSFTSNPWPRQEHPTLINSIPRCRAKVIWLRAHPFCPCMQEAPFGMTSSLLDRMIVTRLIESPPPNYPQGPCDYLLSCYSRCVGESRVKAVVESQELASIVTSSKDLIVSYTMLCLQGLCPQVGGGLLEEPGPQICVPCNFQVTPPAHHLTLIFAAQGGRYEGSADSPRQHRREEPLAIQRLLLHLPLPPLPPQLARKQRRALGLLPSVFSTRRHSGV